MKCAVVAVAHTILTIIYHLLRHRTSCCELDSQYFDERDRQMTERHLLRRFEVVGKWVTIEPREIPLWLHTPAILGTLVMRETLVSRGTAGARAFLAN
jgi:hypothetical protein